MQHYPLSREIRTISLHFSMFLRREKFVSRPRKLLTLPSDVFRQIYVRSSSAQLTYALSLPQLGDDVDILSRYIYFAILRERRSSYQLSHWWLEQSLKPESIAASE